MHTVVFGGSGLVGRRLVAMLVERGHHVVVPVRDRERAKHSLIVLPNTDVVCCNVLVPRSIHILVKDADLVINLLGILHEHRPHTFERLHIEFPRMLCEAIERMGTVRQLIHVSALNASPGGPSKYLRSKGKGEAHVTKLGQALYTVVRPSVLFGKGDKFIELFAKLATLSPVLALPCADAMFQPLWVDDLARMLVGCIGNPVCHGKILLAGGPEKFSLREIVAKLLASMKIRRAVVPLGPALSGLLASTLRMVPFLPPLVTRDNIASMSVPSICEHDNSAARLAGGELMRLDVYLAAKQLGAHGPEVFSSLRQEARRG